MHSLAKESVVGSKKSENEEFSSLSLLLMRKMKEMFRIIFEKQAEQIEMIISKLEMMKKRIQEKEKRKRIGKG